MNLGLNMNRLWFLNFNAAPLILDTYFKFWGVSGQTFSEILRISEKDWQLSLRFSNFHRFLVIGSPRNAAEGENISWAIIESPRMIGNWVPSSRRRIGNWFPRSRRRIGNWVFSCQSFSEILRISEKVWTETHKNLKWLPHIEGASSKFRNQKRFLFRPRCIHTGQKQVQKSHATVPLSPLGSTGSLLRFAY